VSGEPADLIIFPADGWRARKTIMEVVYDGGGGRQVVKNGCLIINDTQ
jgi:hypothetical protein